MRPPVWPDHERLFSIFLELVSIGSESGQESRVSDYIKSFCRSIGLGCIEDQAGRLTGGDCGNLLIKVPGSSWDASEEPLILNCHMDTVSPGEDVVPVEEGDRFTSQSETILGADDKAGIAAVLAVLEFIEVSDIPRRPLEVLFTVQEECGLIGVKRFDSGALEGKCAVVFDGAGPVGGIVVEAPSCDRFRFVLKGKAAHAGVEPEKGINAISCAAEAIAALGQGRLDDNTTSNIGIIKGGRATNIVPDSVVVEGEVRSFSGKRAGEERDRIITYFKKAAETKGCEVETFVERSFNHFKAEDESFPVLLLKHFMEECGVEPHLVTSGGGSDANVLSLGGVNVAAINIGVQNAHSQNEFILKEDLVVVANIIMKLATVEIKGDGSKVT